MIEIGDVVLIVNKKSAYYNCKAKVVKIIQINSQKKFYVDILNGFDNPEMYFDLNSIIRVKDKEEKQK